MSQERLRILEMIDNGTISAADGIKLLNALGDESLPEHTTPILPDPLPAEPAPAQETAAPVAETIFTPEPEDPPIETTIPEPQHAPAIPRLAHFRNFWLVPLITGGAITILSAILMYLAYQAGGIGFWFACTWFPFLIGVMVLALAAASHTTPWVHLRIRQKPGEHPQNINISLPVPVGLIGWALPFFKDKIPTNLNGMNPNELIDLLRHVSPDKPLYIEVDEPGGEHVEVYIG